MKYLSQIFQPILTIPKNAKVISTEITCVSQKLLLECGLIRPTSSGLFTLLPLALRALQKLEGLVRQSIESVGGQQISLPTLTSASLWERSGRLHDSPAELMQLSDRHSKKYILTPTYEEAVADLLADVSPLSYKQLPLLLYQISNKYRDEHRPKHGLLRAREFCMMDAYGAHADAACVSRMYDTVSRAYSALCRRLDLPRVYTVSAPPGDMGGSVSHEWHVVAGAGEDELAVCGSCRWASLPGTAAACGQCGGGLSACTTIEVGHTFVLGTRYSEPLGALFTPPQGPAAPVIMSCYGLGLSRLLAACMETRGGEERVCWPAGVAPYSVLLVGPKEGSKEWASGGWELTQRTAHSLCRLPGLAEDVLVDDRHHMTIGKRLLQAHKMGYPVIMVCGKAALETPSMLEVQVHGAPPCMLSIPDALQAVSGALSQQTPRLAHVNIA